MGEESRCCDPRYTALMRRLNESASWLSDVSGVSDDEPPPREESGREVDWREHRLCLAEMLNESATWLDCDISESDHEERREDLEDPMAGMHPQPDGGEAVRIRAG